MSYQFGSLELGGIGELLFYDECFTKRWNFWLRNKGEIEDLIITLIDKEYFPIEITEESEDNSDPQRLDQLRREIPKIKFQDRPNKETMDMLYTCLNKIDDLSTCKNLKELEERDYNRFYLLCIYISHHIGLTDNAQINEHFNLDTIIDLTELFQISDFLEYPYDYLGEIYEAMIASKRKNIMLRPIDTISNYGLIISQSIFEFPILIDQNVETGRRMLTLSNDYFIILGQSCSVIETMITKINLHIYAPWILSLKSLLNFMNPEELHCFTREIVQDNNLEFSYIYHNEESSIKSNNQSFIDYLLLNEYKTNLYLSLNHDSFPIIMKSKNPDESFNKIPEIQYLPQLLALV